MIQRLQSLYLAIAAALLVAFVLVSDAWAAGLPATASWLAPVGFGLAIVTAIVALVSLALFKDRARQRQLVLVAMWLDLALVVAVLVGLFLSAEAGIQTATYLIGVIPLVAYVLLRMARQRITKDIDLVRSMDRLR